MQWLKQAANTLESPTTTTFFMSLIAWCSSPFLMPNWLSSSCRSLESPLPERLVGVPAENSTHVYFKDMIVAASDDSEDESEPSERGTANSGSELPPRPSRRIKMRARVDRQKLIIILVGLPGRGKTFLCNKLMCYLNWCALSSERSFYPLYSAEVCIALYSLLIVSLNQCSFVCWL